MNMASGRLSTPPDSSASESSLSSDDPRPYFYIVRPDKTFVPLIAIDEINPMFHILGVPNSLTAGNIEEWNMARCGDQIDRPQNYYRIEFSTDGNANPHNHSNGHNDRSMIHDPDHLEAQRFVHPQYEKTFQPYKHHTPTNASKLVGNGLGIHAIQDGETKDIGGAQEKTSSASNETQVRSSPMQNHPDPLLTLLQYAVDQAVKENKWAKEEHPSKTKNAATPGIYGKKKFCTYWIRTGNCDYVQEGCKYLHVIPDEETRLRIGIRDMPRWAKEDIPAPTHDFQPKQSPATSQDWRRGAPRTGHVNELPETSHGQPRPAFPPPRPLNQSNHTQNTQPKIPGHAPMDLSPLAQRAGSELYPSTAATKQLNGVQNGPNTLPPPFQSKQTNGAQNNQHQSQFFDFTTQAFPNHANQALKQNGLNAGASYASPKSPATSVAESYQRQMQANTPCSPPIPATPASASNRYSPPTQPPISRPVNVAYRAPDKIEHLSKNPSQVRGLVQDARFTYPANRQNQYGSVAHPATNQVQSASSPISYGTLTTLPSQFQQNSNQARSSTPTIVGSNSFAQSRTDVAATQGQSEIGSQFSSSSLKETLQHSQSPRADGSRTSSNDLLSQQASRVIGANQDISDIGLNNEDAKAKANTHQTSKTNGMTMGQDGTRAATQSGNIGGSQNSANPPIILHRRHFVPPGESQFVAMSVEAEKATAKNHANGSQKKRARGRGNEAYNLVNTEA